MLVCYYEKLVGAIGNSTIWFFPVYQNPTIYFVCIQEGNSGEDLSSVHHYDRDDRRLTELGRRTVEFFALIQIFR